MTKFREVPGLDIDFRPEIETTLQLPSPSKGHLNLTLHTLDIPVYEGDDIISQAYVPGWYANATEFYRPGQKAVIPELLQPVAENAAFGGAGRISLADDLPAFMNELEIQSMVLTGSVSSSGITQDQVIRLMLGLAPEYKGVLAQPVTMIRNTIHQIKTQTMLLEWQITLNTGSHVQIPVQNFDFDQKYGHMLIPAFGHLLNDDPDKLFRYSWR